MQKHTYKINNEYYKNPQVITELDNEDGEIFQVIKTERFNNPIVKRWHIEVYCDTDRIYSDYWKDWSACCIAYDEIVEDLKNNNYQIR